jgi:DNA repair protein RadA/Sms
VHDICGKEKVQPERREIIVEETKVELKMINMADVQASSIDWLWYPFIPYGKLTIIQGDPGDGKSTLVLNIAAKLSKGEGLDDEMKPAEPINVIYQTAEDGLADTVKPRLELAGADCSRISIIDESEKSVSMVGTGDFAYRRQDGIYIVPIGCLKN